MHAKFIKNSKQTNSLVRGTCKIKKIREKVRGQVELEHGSETCSQVRNAKEPRSKRTKKKKEIE